MKTWLITGGAGFIGSNFVRKALRENGQRLIVLDALTYAGNLSNLSDLLESPKLEFVKGDICDSKWVMDLFARYPIDKIVHFAAESHVDRSILGSRPFIKTNIEGTFNLLEAARESWGNSRGKLFLHVSTDEVYGSLGPEDPPFDENSPFRPNSPYSASKASADHLVRAWSRTYGLNTIISNCSNNYGPFQFPEKLIPLMILNAIEKKELPVYGDGKQVRDWLHVEDHCSALLKILEKGTGGDTYNIGGGNEWENIQVVYLICDSVDRLLGRGDGTSRKLIRHVTDRPGHDRRYAINTSRISREMDWNPRWDFKDGISDVVSWYLKNKEWCDSVRTGDYRSYYDRQYKGRDISFGETPKV